MDRRSSVIHTLKWRIRLIIVTTIQLQHYITVSRIEMYILEHYPLEKSFQVDHCRPVHATVPYLNCSTPYIGSQSPDHVH